MAKDVLMSDLPYSDARYLLYGLMALLALLPIRPAAAQETRTTTSTQATYETRTSTKDASRAVTLAGTIRPRRSHRSQTPRLSPVRTRLPHVPAPSRPISPLSGLTNPYLLSVPETTETTNSFRTTYRRTTTTRSGTDRPVLPTPPRTPTAAPDPDGQVWLNTQSGIYWRPGSRWFGKTRQGRFLTEAEAIQAGYRAASGQ